LLRYQKTGQIWSVQRQGCKVRWTNLKTTDVEMARAKLQTRPWQQAQKVIDAAIKKYQIDEPEDPGHPKTVPANPAKVRFDTLLSACATQTQRNCNVSSLLPTQKTRDFPGTTFYAKSR